jgi:hypothetical protein
MECITKEDKYEMAKGRVERLNITQAVTPRLNALSAVKMLGTYVATPATLCGAV